MNIFYHEPHEHRELLAQILSLFVLVRGKIHYDKYEHIVIIEQYFIILYNFYI